MIRPLAAFLHVLDAARTAGTLARTVRVLARQLDNAHLLAASEGARADRAELRVAELENEIRDWREASGELAREQPAADPLPDLTDAAPPPATPDPLRETDYHRDRADSLMRTLHATEATVLDLRAACARTERELAETRAQLRQTEGAAGAHVATISALREQIAAAHRAAHAPARTLEERADIARRAWDESPPADPGPVEWDELPPAGQAAWCAVVRACDTSAAPAEQIPGVAAARMLSRLECTICPYVARELDEEAGDKCPSCGSKLAEVESCDACGKPVRDAYRTGEAEAVLLCGRCYAQGKREAARVLGADDDPPATKPSERPAKETSR